MITEILINGSPSDGRIPVTDSSVLRGDGCFEVVRSYDGRVFALREHLDRLERSAAMLSIDLPPRDDLARWIAKTATELGEGVVRVVVTRGSNVPGLADPPNVIVFGHTTTGGDQLGRLLPVAAPWHSAGTDWDLAGAKTISYGPNMAASRRAEAAGFEDALLLTSEGIVLEGPTFSVGWLVDGALETPGLELGILDSITRRIALELAAEAGLSVMEGSWRLDRLDHASEVTAWSTVREIQPVVEVGERRFQPGPVTERLHTMFRDRVKKGTVPR